MKPIDDVLEYVLTDHTWLAADATLAPALPTARRTVFQTGTWVLRDRTPLPAGLETFIEGGEPPIFAGFGSMPAAGDTTRRLIDAARAVGRRIIVAFRRSSHRCLAISSTGAAESWLSKSALPHHTRR